MFVRRRVIDTFTTLTEKPFKPLLNMMTGKLLRLLLALHFYTSTNTSAEDVSVTVGDTAFLPCPLLFTDKDVVRIDVEWVKDGKLSFCKFSKFFIVYNNTQPSNCSSRFNVNTEPLGINITGVKSSDAGLYTCLMTRLIPPPVETRNLTLRLKVLPSLTLQLNSTNISCVKLLCSLQDLPPQQVNFTWTKATQLLYHHNSSNLSSMLTLCKPNWTERETLSCHASYSENRTYSKYIRLPCISEGCNGKTQWLFIASISASAVLLLCILLGVAVFKCRKRNAERSSVMYRNKIYENFTFNSATISSNSNPQTLQPTAESNTRNTARYSPRTNTTTQREECIYEN